ncbi:MFS transporter [Methylobacterium indicum]|uniref:MFS transporter n=1 Tax=Methylobacterium indicum TaxID=1775910 RepID=UPI000652B8D8|nr:MFS transporter [Methylobacterium indicum]
MQNSSASAPNVQRPVIPRTVWVLGFVSLLMDVSSEIVQALLPLYLVGTLGASAALVGFVEGFSVAVATTTKLFSGIITDWSGRRKPMVIAGYGLGAASKLIFPVASSIGWIVGAKAIDRVGKGIRGTPRDALIADVTPPELRGASFGLRKSLDTVGGFLGPLVAIGLLFLFGGNVQAVFWVAVVPALLAVALLVVGIEEPVHASPVKKDGPPRVADAVRLGRGVWLTIFVACLLTAARFSEAFLLLKSQEAGFSLTWVPITLVIMHAVYGLTAYPVGRLSDAIGRTGLLGTSLVFLVVAYMVLAHASSVSAFMVGIVLWGLHMGFSQGLLATLIADSAPAALRGTAFGVFNLLTGVTVLAGNVAAGLMWDAYGSYGTFITGASLSAAGAVAFGLIAVQRLRLGSASSAKRT